MKSGAQYLWQLLHKFLDESFCLNTRVHPLNNYIQTENQTFFIKRDDELSAGVAGSKYRKYASLIHTLKSVAPDEVLLIGGGQSNNIVGLLQLLIENNFQARPMLLRPHTTQLMGNELWTQMLTGNNIIYIDREDWPQVNYLAEEYRKELKVSGKNIFIVPEGAAMKEALPGAITLAADVLSFEEKNGLKFNNIFIDSGTGLAAIGLILGIGKASNFQRNIHITLIAGNEEYFRSQLENFRQEAEIIFSEGFSINHLQLHFHKPVVAPSFGAVTNSVLHETVAIARSEGILMEPLYSVKHLITVKHILEICTINGKSLFIYSGGSFALAGWQQKLANIIAGYK